jgi:hypothetical protein
VFNDRIAEFRAALARLGLLQFNSPPPSVPIRTD